MPYAKEVEAHKAKARQAKEDGTAPGEPPDEPVLRRVVCGDTTIEKLIEILEDNPRGILVARDELAGWLGSFTRYKQKGSTDLPNWLELHRAGTVAIDRKTGERRLVYVTGAAASVTGGIQPGVLTRALTQEFLDAGLAARILLAMPTRRPKRWSEVEVAPETERDYQDLLDALLTLTHERDAQGEHAPHVLRLSPEAKQVWVAFFNDWAREQAAAEGEVAAALSKLEGYAARLALLHHVVTCIATGADDRAPVGPASVEAGVTLCRWFAAEARRIYSTLTESEEARDARHLIEHIRAREGRITARELQRANSRKYPTADAAEAALDALVQAGLAQWVDGDPSPRGGHRRRWLELCPTHDTSDTRSEDEEDARP
jgi:hypothetical protein